MSETRAYASSSAGFLQVTKKGIASILKAFLSSKEAMKAAYRQTPFPKHW